MSSCCVLRKCFIAMGAACVLGLVPTAGHAAEDTAALVEGNSDFALRLYKQVAAEAKAGDDVVLGPVSISQALALTEAGARGSTRDEMQTTLGWKQLGDQLHPGWRKLRKTWDEVKGIEWMTANRLFVQKGISLKRDYLDLCRTMHAAEPEQCDFGQIEMARRVINKWVSKQTRKHIPELFREGELTAGTSAVLVNACYFKGEFMRAFKRSDTEKNTPFHRADGSIPCAMMHQTGMLEYMEDDAVQVVRLPYGSKRSERAEAYLTVVVPKAVDGLAAVESSLDAVRLAGWQQALSQEELEFGLPRFTSRTHIDLVGTLSTLGIEQLFDDGADLSGMFDSPHKIAAVVHEAMVATDESGSTAAAATGVVAVPIGFPSGPITVTADRPFLWLITDAASNSVLFIGRVTNPSDDD